MKRFLTSWGPLLLALSIFAVALESNAAAFQNGSFESPRLSPPGEVLPSGSTNITGWVTGGPGTVSLASGPRSGVTPEDGAQQIGFNGGNTETGATLSQVFDTIPRQSYTIRFFVRRAASGGGTMSVVAQGTS